MKAELQKLIFNLYPNMFRDKDKGPQHNLMWFGFECGDGWYKLIVNLCDDINKISENVVVMQVKEKYGGLRFHIYGGNAEVYDLIDKAEKESYNICETCGAIGQLRMKNLWYKTLCTKCSKKEGGYKVVRGEEII